MQTIMSRIKAEHIASSHKITNNSTVNMLKSPANSSLINLRILWREIAFIEIIMVNVVLDCIINSEFCVTFSPQQCVKKHVHFLKQIAGDGIYSDRMEMNKIVKKGHPLRYWMPWTWKSMCLVLLYVNKQWTIYRIIPMSLLQWHIVWLYTKTYMIRHGLPIRRRWSSEGWIAEWKTV